MDFAGYTPLEWAQLVQGANPAVLAAAVMYVVRHMDTMADRIAERVVSRLEVSAVKAHHERDAILQALGAMSFYSKRD